MHERSADAPAARLAQVARIRPDDPVMELLGANFPLSLIMDLAMPAGPHSRELLNTEPADDGSWLDDL